MKRITIIADEGLLLEIRQLGDELNKSTSQIVREALQEYLKIHRRRRQPISFVGTGNSGEGDISERAEEILAAEIDKESGWR